MDNKFVTLVTGAASGIGYATACHIQRLRGDHVIFSDLATSISQAPKLDGGGIYLPADVTREDDVAALYDEITKKFKKIDNVIHCAGIEEKNTPAMDMAADVFRRTLDVNVTGSFLVARGAARHMVGNGQGSIVLIGSILSVVGYAGLSAYCASKGAVLQLAKTMSLELAAAGVRVNVVGPGFVETPMAHSLRDPARRDSLMINIPANRPAMSMEIASVCTFLTGAGSEYINGAYIPVDGGYTAR